MGGIEDGEPPLKRVKVPLEESNSTKTVAGSLGVSMARSLPSHGDGETIGSKGVIKKPEFIRLITRALYSLGYDKSGALLEEESGITLHSSAVSLFMQHVLKGKWSESIAALRIIGLPDETMVKSASLLILEQKFFEFLNVGRDMDALDTLQNEILPLCTNMSRVHDLAACMISPLQCKELGFCDEGIAGSAYRSKTLEKLQKILPPAFIIPEKRLEYLVEQALDVQREACAFHNALDSELSLYCDHQCGRNKIPSQTLQVLQEHTDEVWFVQFSHNGKYLASTSKDQSVAIWEVNEDCQVSLKYRLFGHKQPVLTASWSPDDNQLLTCGQEEVIRRWDVNSGTCLHIYEKNGVSLISCGWLPDGKKIFSGMTDESICMWDLEGRELECLKGHRTISISDLAITDDGKTIFSRCSETEISLFKWETKTELLIEEDDVITSFSLSKDNKFLLVNLLNQQIHLWSIEGDLKVLSNYTGHKRDRFLIRSCFGGYEQAFIASGSEDSQVYIWHRSETKPLLVLPGHSGAVNSVSWNPANLHMLASCSDDRTIRIWGLEHFKPKRKDLQSNGETPVHHYSNGNV